MFSWLISSSMQIRGLVIALAVGFAIFAFMQIEEMPVDVFPEFNAPSVEIQTEALGLSAEEVKSLVTLNIEELLAGVPWVTSMHSESMRGLSSIRLTFERGTDLMEARQMISERLTLAYALPNISDPPRVIQPKSTTNRLMMVGLRSDDIEPTELSILAKWVIQPRLQGIPGVSNVAVWGLKPKEMHVQITPERLRDARLMQDDVIDAAGNSLWVTPLTFLKGHSPGTGGFIDNANQRLGIQHDMPILEPEDMAKIPVTPKHLVMTGKLMNLGDISEVSYSHPPLIGDAIVDNRAGLMLVIDKLPSANTVEVTEAVNEALAGLQLGLPGITLDAKVFQLATYVEDSIDNILTALLLGAVIMAVVIGIFLQSLKATVISLISILLSLLSALVVMGFSGATLNTMVLSGLLVALGMVIADAIIDVRRIQQRFAENATGEDPLGLAACIFRALLSVKTIALFSLTAIALAVSPIFFMEGVAGAFLEPLAATALIAALSSYLVGMTVTPALAYWLFTREESGAQSNNRVGAWLALRFESLAVAVLDHAKAVVMGAAAMIVVGLLIAIVLAPKRLPAFSENNVIVALQTAPGTSLRETTRIVARMADELNQLSAVGQVDAHIGRAVAGDQIVGINQGQIWLTLNPDVARKQALASIAEVINAYPGVETRMQTYLRNTVSQAISGQEAPIAVRIYGQNLDVLERKAEEVRAALTGIEDLKEVRIVQPPTEPQINVKIDVDAASKAGVKPGEVRRSAATVFSGINVGFLFEEQKLFNVAVWSAPEIRASITDLENVLVEKSDRSHVRLGDIASVRVVAAPTAIRHENISAYIDVVATPDEASIGSVSREIESALEKISFPLAYHPEILGEDAERQGVAQRVSGLIAMALIAIFLLLQACFHNWKVTLFAFLGIPAAIAGGFVAVLLSGATLTLGSVVGLLALTGISARFVMVYIEGLQRAMENKTSNRELLIKGIQPNLIPLLASATATIVALLPVALSGQHPGLEIIAPAAQVIIAGLIVAIPVILLVVPACFTLFGVNLAPDSEMSAELRNAESQLNYRNMIAVGAKE